MRRHFRSAPVLTPNTAKALVESFAYDTSNAPGYASSSSDSPDSLYSDGSPTFQNQCFEFDEELEQQVADEYDAGPEVIESLDSPTWGKWPETTTAHPGWSPAPSSTGTPLKAPSIISVSPPGSYGSWSRRSSVPRSRLDDPRRDSNPSLLGFDLSQRRRSSIRSFNSSRRRSSAMSSVLDPIEDARLLNIASMSGLGRRFSEVVEVTCPSSDSEKEDTAAARRAFSQWSSDSTDDGSDVSEILTVPYVPTPEAPVSVPTILSNFPLSSVAVQQPSTPSDMSISPAPPSFPRSRRLPLSTPSPEPSPSILLRSRVRPAFSRAVSDYQFPPKSTIGVPPGAAPPRPSMPRSISAPFMSQTRVAPITFQTRIVPSLFPVTQAPLGTSPLREMIRRQSTCSDGEGSRRTSLTEHRASLAERRASLADRRTSLVKDLRRSSTDSRRSSVTKSGSRKSSIPGIRRPSVGSIRRSSLSSRKGSWVEGAAEFAYLAPQIVVDTPHEPSLRRNTPSGLSLSSLAYHSSSNATTPRFNPMESFLGTASQISTPTVNHSPLSPFDDFDQTPSMAPALSPTSVLNRGRPVSPPEFTQSFPFWTKNATIPKQVVPETVRPVSILRKAVPKMSMEELSIEARRDELMRKERGLEQKNFELRGAAMFSSDEQALLRGAGAHRRTGSSNDVQSPRRPVRGRQTTLPVELESDRLRQRRSLVLSAPQPSSSPEEKASPRVNKRSSVTFNTGTTAAVAPRPNMNRTSSFSRFFHSRSKSVVSSPEQKLVRPPIRPISTDSSGSDRTLVEVREIFRKLGVSSPKKFTEEDEDKVPVSKIVA